MEVGEQKDPNPVHFRVGKCSFSIMNAEVNECINTIVKEEGNLVKPLFNQIGDLFIHGWGTKCCKWDIVNTKRLTLRRSPNG